MSNDWAPRAGDTIMVGDRRWDGLTMLDQYGHTQNATCPHQLGVHLYKGGRCLTNCRVCVPTVQGTWRKLDTPQGAMVHANPYRDGIERATRDTPPECPIKVGDEGWPTGRVTGLTIGDSGTREQPKPEPRRGDVWRTTSKVTPLLLVYCFEDGLVKTHVTDNMKECFALDELTERIAEGMPVVGDVVENRDIAHTIKSVEHISAELIRYTSDRGPLWELTGASDRTWRIVPPFEAKQDPTPKVHTSIDVGLGGFTLTLPTFPKCIDGFDDSAPIPYTLSTPDTSLPEHNAAVVASLLSDPPRWALDGQRCKRGAVWAAYQVALCNATEMVEPRRLVRADVVAAVKAAVAPDARDEVSDCEREHLRWLAGRVR